MKIFAEHKEEKDELIEKMVHIVDTKDDIDCRDRMREALLRYKKEIQGMFLSEEYVNKLKERHEQEKKQMFEDIENMMNLNFIKQFPGYINFKNKYLREGK